MSIAEIKSTVESYFQTNWIETEIDWNGVDFITPSNKEWISIQTIPFDRVPYAYDGTGDRKRDDVIIKVRAYAPNPHSAFVLQDELITFLEGKELLTTQYLVGKPDGNGATSLENGIYEVAIDFITNTWQ